MALPRGSTTAVSVAPEIVTPLERWLEISGDSGFVVRKVRVAPATVFVPSVATSR